MIKEFNVQEVSGYTVMPNYHLRDTTLSLKAKGLLSVMLSLPEEWDYSKNGLIAICKEGRDSVTATLSELKEKGYLTITKNEGGGRFTYTYTVHPKPCGFSGTGNPYTENPCTENPHQLNTKQLNTNKSITKISNASAETLDGVVAEAPAEMRDALEGFIEMRKVTLRKPLTPRALRGAIKRAVKLSNGTTQECIKIFEQSIDNGWASVYELKKNKSFGDLLREINDD